MSGRSRGKAGIVMNCAWAGREVQQSEENAKSGPVEPSEFLPWPNYGHSSKERKITYIKPVDV